MHITVEYVCDWRSASGDDQNGHIKVTTPTGAIEATWSCRDGKGRGAELISNSTQEFDDDEADELVNAADLCQGDGTYEADLGRGEYGIELHNVVWRG